MLKGYKVVRQRYPKSPLMSSSHQLVGAVEYKPGEVTRPLPGNGPLAVFSDKEPAVEFIRQQVAKQHTYTDTTPYYLYECEYTPHTPEGEEEYALWQLYECDGNFLTNAGLPSGTVRASEVVLGLRVEPPDWMGDQPVWWEWGKDAATSNDPHKRIKNYLYGKE